MSTCCIIIPCYNEEFRLPCNEIQVFLEANPRFSICFVNDGSKDNTKGIIKLIVEKFPDRIKYIHLEINQGKAEAVRKGLLDMAGRNEYSYLGYFDADLSTPLSEICPMLNLIISENLTLVMGSRIKRMGATINRNPYRHYFGRVFATLASMALNLPVYDTQCGAKILRSKIVSEIFAEKFISRWLFDVEILYRLIITRKITGIEPQIKEYPLTMWIEKGKSKISPFYILKVPLELLRIHLKYNEKKVTCDGKKEKKIIIEEIA